MAGLCALLVWAAGATAATEYYALLIRKAQPPDFVLMEKVKLNGKDELYRLVKEGRISEREYKALPRMALGDVRRMRVKPDALEVSAQNQAVLLALPQNVKSFGTGPLETRTMIRDAVLAGRPAGGKGSLALSLQAGWVVYIFATRPGDDSIAFALAEVENSEDGWKRFLARFGGSPHAAVAREQLGTTYVGRAQAALARYREALEKRTRGYANLGEARQWLDQARAVNYQGPSASAVENEITRYESDVAERLRQARSLAEGAKFDEAEELLKPLSHFRQEFPQLARELDAVQELRARHHLDEARRHLSLAEFDAAEGQLDAAAKIRNLPEIADLRRDVAEQRVSYARQKEIEAGMSQAQQAIAQGDLGRAFELLWPVAAKFGDEPKLQENFAALRSTYGQDLLTRVPQIESLHTPIRGSADEEILLRMQGHLTRLTQVEASPTLTVLRDGLSQHLSDYYRQRAKELTERGGEALAALAFAFLHQARYFALDKAEIADYSPTREQVEEKLRVGVALNFRDQTPEAGGGYLLTELSTAVGEAIQKGGFPHVYLFETGRTVPTRASLEFVVEITGVGVSDNAETEPVNSEYSAGMRQVPNPEWRTAKEAYDQTLDRYEEIRTRIERRTRQGRYPKREREADEQALFQADVARQAAKKKQDALEAFIAQEDVRPYEFSRRKITRSGFIRLAYRWINLLTGVREAQDTLEEREPGEGIEITGVQPADKRGHRNQPAALPEAAALRGRVLRKIQEQLTARALAHLKTFIDRDFERARQEAERGNPENAAEHYLRFLYNIRANDDRRAAAFDFLRQQFRLVALGEWLGVKGETP